MSGGAERARSRLRRESHFCYGEQRNGYAVDRNAVDNPFVYGEVVARAAFADRESELDRLVADLAAAQKVFLISPRRYGKSSLIRRALEILGRRAALTVDVTVSSYSSYVAFLEGYAGALAALQTPRERAREWLADAITATRPELRYEPRGARSPGQLTVAFPAVRTDREVTRLANDIFALPGRIASERRRTVVVALDEFQAIDGFNGGTVEHALRAAAQQQRQVGYVFAGSEPTLMERIVGPRRPFYKAGPIVRLERIAPAVFADFIEARFTDSGLRPERGLGAAIVDLAGNLPYDVQRLAHETWDDVRAAGGRRAGLDDLHATLTRLLGEQNMMFEAVWQRLTLPQRAVLRAVVLQQGRELLSADTRARHRLGGPSSIQASLGALMKQDLVLKEAQQYVVVDSLFREWIARTTF